MSSTIYIQYTGQALTLDPTKTYNIGLYNPDRNYNDPFWNVGTFTGAITGFGGNDTFDLSTGYYGGKQTYPDSGPYPLHYVRYDGTNATVFNDNGTIALRFPISGGFTNLGLVKVIPPGGGFPAGYGSELVACYLTGTRIATPSGQQPIEELCPGDLVLTATGQARPIRWIGRRSYDLRLGANNAEAAPIRISAGALAENVPARDLYVSPRHAMLIDGVLIPAASLANGITIHRAGMTCLVEYLHVELDSHDAVLAEGAASETFCDCGNRWMFQNADTAPSSDAPNWEFCAPRLEHGPVLDAIHRRLAQRAAALNPVTTDATDLHLLADGMRIDPETHDDGTFLFRLANTPSTLRIRSDRQLGTAPPRGVALHRITLMAAHVRMQSATGDLAPDGVCHPVGSLDRRWLDGDTELPATWLALFSGELTVSVEASLHPSTRADRLDQCA